MGRTLIVIVGIVAAVFGIWYLTLTSNEKILVQNKLTCIRHQKDPKWYIVCYNYNTDDGRLTTFTNAPYPKLLYIIEW